jgi:hypothetical protein
MGRKRACLEDLHIDERIILKKQGGRVYMDWIYFAQNTGQCGDFVNTVRNAGNLERLLHGDRITNPRILILVLCRCTNACGCCMGRMR